MLRVLTEAPIVLLDKDSIKKTPPQNVEKSLRSDSRPQDRPRHSQADLHHPRGFAYEYEFGSF